MDGQGEVWNEALGSWQTSLPAKELADREIEREKERERAIGKPTSVIKDQLNTAQVIKAVMP